ncbi:hypothetical protein [Xanthomonas sp. NCPPB 2632]|uniref:hypothetical protein n=1 Tax=Xanthomonas sp. NCPPB 2632 TaxID=3240912 RepID=UPI0035116C39
MFVRYILEQRPIEQCKDARIANELKGILGESVALSDVSVSAIRMLLHRARQVVDQEHHLEAKEASISRKLAGIDTIERDIARREAAITRRLTIDADFLALQNENRRLKIEIKEYIAKHDRILEGFRRCRGESRAFRVELARAKRLTYGWNSLLGYIAKNSEAAPLGSEQDETLSPYDRFLQFLDVFPDLTSDHLLWFICNEWRCSGGSAQPYLLASILLDQYLDRLWSETGMRDDARDSRSSIDRMQPQPSNFRAWSVSVRDRFGH